MTKPEQAGLRNQLEEIFSNECNGPYCQHETAEKHYFLGDDDKQRIATLIDAARIKTAEHCFAIAETRADRNIWKYLEELSHPAPVHKSDKEGS